MRKGSRRQRYHTGRAWEKRSVRHARGRLGERYGITVSEQGYAAIVRAIQERQARYLYRQNQRTTWWLVEICGVRCIAVYNAYLRRIQTFLGLEALSDIGVRIEDVA